MIASSSGPRVRTGASWMTGSTRSSARQIEAGLGEAGRDRAADQALKCIHRGRLASAWSAW